MGGWDSGVFADKLKVCLEIGLSSEDVTKYLKGRDNGARAGTEWKARLRDIESAVEWDHFTVSDVSQSPPVLTPQLILGKPHSGGQHRGKYARYR